LGLSQLQKVLSEENVLDAPSCFLFRLREIHARVTAEPTGDVKVQTTKVLASIDGLLQKAGTDKSKLLTAYLWLADMRDFEEHNSIWNEWVDRQNPPVRFCVQSPLWRPNILVEIMVTAAQ
jgi:enamine deaminase RidA (YjgF/YER057c/UK114 family)